MLRIALVLAVALIASASHAAEGPSVCGEFRTSWSGALRKLGLVKASPEFGAPNKDGVEAIQGIAGVEGRFHCREGIVGLLGLRSAEDTAKLETAVASVLMGLDREMTAENAAAMAAALKAESQGPKKEGMSPWGPYELVWTPQGATGARFVLNLPEN